MYFYKLLGGDYESSNETTYYSNTKYTQKEFEDIVFDCFQVFCENLVKNHPISLCYPNINFTFDDIIWDYKGDFNKLMSDKGFYPLTDKLTGYMFFDLTCDGFYGKIYNDVDDSYQQRADEIFNNLDIDESCWEDCRRLQEECAYDSIEELEEEKEYCRKECMVCYRKNFRKKC